MNACRPAPLKACRRPTSLLPWGPLALALSLAACGSAARAATYYVATNGDDSRTPAQAMHMETPWKTLNASVAKLTPGDTLYARAGVYVEALAIWVSGTSTAPITIAAYPGEAPVIDGQGTLPLGDWDGLVGMNGDYLHVSGFEVRNSVLGHHARGVELWGTHNRLSRCNVHHVMSNGVLISGDYGIVEDSMVWESDQDNATNPGSGWGSGLSAARGTNTDDHITDNAIIRRNLVFRNWGEGLSTYEARGTLIEDNVVYDNYAQNVYISDASDVMFRRNIVYKTPGNAYGPNTQWALADEVVSVPRSSNNTIINNLFYNINLSAFEWTIVPGSGLTNALIANNTFVDGTLHTGPINSGNRIENNVFTVSGRVPSATGISWGHNLWQQSPPPNAVGPGDMRGDPLLARAGPTGPGQLTAAYFALASPASPAINHAAVLAEVPKDYFRRKRGAMPDIGAHEYKRVDSSTAQPPAGLAP